MKTVLLIILAAVSLATSACTTTAGSGYYLPLPPLPIPQRIDNGCYDRSYPTESYNTRPYRPRYSYNSYQPEQQYIKGPMYYRSNVPYYRGNIKNYTGVPIVAPDACNPGTNVIIPNSWN